MFKIDGENFGIEQAYIDALLDDLEEERLIIGLVIEGKRVDDKTLPFIDSETLLKIKRHEIKKWQDIADRIIEWEKPSKNKNRPYIQFHNAGKSITTDYLYSTKIEFKSVGDKMFVHIKGFCDSKFNGKERKTLSLEIETEIDFKWIQIGQHESEEIARNRLKPFLDEENFKYRIANLKLSNGSVEVGRFDLDN